MTEISFLVNCPFNDSQLHVSYCLFKSCTHLIYRHASVSLSTVYFNFRHNQLSLYVKLVCFDNVSSKDNFVEKSGAVRQAF